MQLKGGQSTRKNAVSGWTLTTLQISVVSLTNVTWRNWLGDQIFQSNHIVPKNQEDSISHYASAASLPPVMAVYAQGKPSPGSSAVLQHIQEQWASQLRVADAVVVVGVRPVPADAHVWGPLGAVGCPADYVGPDSGHDNDKSRMTGDCHVRICGSPGV
jgi:hypothetical protein